MQCPSKKICLMHFLVKQNGEHPFETGKLSCLYWLCREHCYENTPGLRIMFHKRYLCTAKTSKVSHKALKRQKISTYTFQVIWLIKLELEKFKKFENHYNLLHGYIKPTNKVTISKFTKKM